MPNSGPSYLEEKLTQHGSQVGKRAFDSLVARGCDASILGNLLVFLTADSLTLPANEKSGRMRSIRAETAPCDSWETALAPVTRGELLGISTRAKKLLDDIARLRRSRWVKALGYEGTLPNGDFLRGSPLLVSPSSFWGLLNLPKLAKQCGPQARPEHTRRLRKIYEHIHERTRRWHDAQLADILNDLRPEWQTTEPSLKEWRKRHGIR